MTPNQATTANDFRIVCGWCGTELHAGSPGAHTSHGMCPGCAATFDQAYHAADAKILQVRAKVTP